MNIHETIKQLDKQIAETQLSERAYWRIYDQKTKDSIVAANQWTKLATALRELEIKRNVLNGLANGTPADEDIGRTVRIEPSPFTGLPTRSTRIPIFKGDQEKEFTT